ncbi:uncharacterized protein Z519_03042 [Cladophialophora bantiana CBS 173.52]|uniref:Enoyl reductase (ER) domain-containing protein n=1 Tax=Cladophialophora bantiana (strain ATCC 10958 / CBS 173.52 / CDC B-1940 / NIH 8579) TaxID=1442370 RepID=A0A0D2F1D1_CLAB1|nr:uncharacterized protein Z519_03042 [Cladophialophora bantiana CBS 173.52]KIW95976.1 hypothetical protein Z519_03042 [Cladophialophora bantiana CBS 173.52]
MASSSPPSSTPAAPQLPETMRAWQFTSAHGGLEKNLKLNNSAALPPHDAKALGKDKVLVKVLAAALNPVDYKIAEMPLIGRLAIKTPATPGLDFAGRVVAVPEPASAASAPQRGDDVKVGQLVFGRLEQPTHFGTLAEYTVARKAALAVVPEGVKTQDAACVATAGLTAYQAIAPNVNKGAAATGDKGPSRVFINGGSGGTGTWGIQIAKALGCHVVASCSGKNVELCKSLGADEVLDYTKEDILGALKKMATASAPTTTTAAAATNGSGGAGGPSPDDSQKFDLVVDNVGNLDKLYWQCHHFTSPKAKYVQVGMGLSGYAALQLILKMVWPGFLGGGKRKYRMMMVASDAAQLKQIGEWMAEGKVKAVVDEVVPMENAPKAFEKLKTGHAKGKIVVAVSDQ